MVDATFRAGPRFAPALLAADAVGQLNGHWQGSLVRQSVSLPVAFDFAEEHGVVTGRFSSPEQRVLEFPLDAPPVLVGNHVSLALAGGSLVLAGTFTAAR